MAYLFPLVKYINVQDCMVGLLFAFMPVRANNRSGGDVNHFDVLHTLFRRGPAPFRTRKCSALAIPCIGCLALV